MAAYNCADYLGPAVESVLRQTYRHLELHIVNDGSTDGTGEVARRYLSDPRVRYYEQANAGQTRAKNRGIEASTGQFIAFCDADDLWLPDKLALQIPRFRHSDRVGVVYSRCTWIGPDGKRVAVEVPEDRYQSGRITEALFKSNIIPFGTAVVRRSCLDEMGSFDERYRMGIDWDLWLRLSTRFEFVCVNESTYLYRIWPGQMSKDWRGRYDAAFRIMSEFLARNPGLLPPAVVRDAWVDCYVQRARLRARLSADYIRALGDLRKALRWKFHSTWAWKSIGYVFAAAVGRRAA
jgi:glycosyltransferase involved in cell wall biosynthesis